MKTETEIIKNKYGFKRSTYNPALDHLEGQVFFKEKMERARAFLKAHPIPKELIEKLKEKRNS